MDGVAAAETTRLEAQRARLLELVAQPEMGSERSDRLLNMYEIYGERLLEAPASGKAHYHNAYPGGYLDHVLNVYDLALKQTRIYKDMGGWTNYTKAELTMAALHHDLWKLGMPGGAPYYIIEESQWHRENQGSLYKHNDALPFMKVTDGASFILQSLGIPVNYNEWTAMRLSDGMYQDQNKAYLAGYSKFGVRTSLAHIIHWADHMSATVESDGERQAYVHWVCG